MDYIKFLLIGTIFIVFTVAILLKGQNISCNAIAKELNYKAHFGIFTGCVLEKSNGQKVLLQQLRDFNYDR